MVGSSTVHRIGYGSWKQLLAGPIGLVGLALLLLSRHIVPGQEWVTRLWVAGMAVLLIDSLVLGLRSRQGISLGADGITWHRHGLFIPWSYVSGASLRTGRSGERLVLEVIAPEQLRDGLSLFAKAEVKAALKTYDGFFALRTDRLAEPAEQVVVEIHRLTAEYAELGGVRAFPRRSPRKPALRIANVQDWIRIVAVVVTLVVFAGSFAHTSTPPALVFKYQARGTIDQVLTISNPEYPAIAPTLAFTALDAAGRPLPGVTVTTAFGSDKGRNVIPPESLGSDILSFHGTGSQDVRDVKVKVVHTVNVDQPYDPADELHAERINASGKEVGAPQPFDILRLPSDFRQESLASVRMVCIIWGPPADSGTRQALQVIPIGGLIEVDPVNYTDVPVTGELKGNTQRCGSVQTYYSW
jgi:hypothetical protein